VTATRTWRLLLLATPILYFAGLRPRLLGWGASSEERREPLPGDDIVAARWQTTRGIDISAPAAEVWPWLVQMGYGRAGWYSYDWLERRVGAGEFAEGGSAKRLIPELQELAVGDAVALSAAGGLTVAVLDPGSALVLHYRMNLFTAAPAHEPDPVVLDWTWTFVVTSIDEASSRLLARVRADYRPPWLRPLLPLLLEPVHFIMERKMLLTIERQTRLVRRRTDAAIANGGVPA
jgi:hypothetical protein